MSTVFELALLLLSSAGADSSTVAVRSPAAETRARDPEGGREVYRQRCSMCHGREGRGDGVLARRLDPPPADFTAGKYKLRSTATGELPTDEDLFRTITRGIRGTAMPPWSRLSIEDRWRLVDYLRTLSPAFAEREGEAPDLVEVPPVPADLASRTGRGREVYLEAQCERCHGPEGRGDGPAADELLDHAGRRSFPFDLTRGEKLKSGGSAEALYLVLHGGLDGTPMPAFDGALGEDDTWALIAYVQSMALDRR